MHDVKFLSDHFRLSERAINRRLAALQTALGSNSAPYLTRGKVDKYLVSDNGLVLLNRMLELERSGLTIEEAARRVQIEMGDEGSNLQWYSEKSPTPKSADSRQASDELIAMLHETIDLLKSQIVQKDKQIERLQDLLQNRLPGQVEATEETDIHYLKQIIQTQREEIEALRNLLEEMRIPWWRKLIGHRYPHTQNPFQAGGGAP